MVRRRLSATSFCSISPLSCCLYSLRLWFFLPWRSAYQVVLNSCQPGEFHGEIPHGSMWVNFTFFVLLGVLYCDCTYLSLCTFHSVLRVHFLCVWVCAGVEYRGREIPVKESFDFTGFLSCGHLLPSSNLFVYEAKMHSERPLRQLDNPPHTHTHSHPTCTCNL